MTRNAVRFLWQDPGAATGFRAGVSLHSHTMHSHEGLGFIPRYANRVPLFSWEFGRLMRRYQAFHGQPLDFSAAYWTPPLPPREALDVESKQIETSLGLRAMVSLTDHDNIAAGTQLQVLDREIPISLEWTIPFGETFFHLGIHNLPHSQARDLVAALAGYTLHPEAERLRDLLAVLDVESEVLIVLNHPMWDQAVIGAGRHRTALRDLLESVGDRIHALELNGVRPWEENSMVLDLARDLGRTLISGGDRHGREPNALINLTDAATFTEFVEEIRSGDSHVLFLPHYREPLGLRILQMMCDVLGDCPDLAGRERWTDRIAYTSREGELVPLSSIWNGRCPAAARWFVRGVGIVGSRQVQRALRPLLIENHEFRRNDWSPSATSSERASGAVPCQSASVSPAPSRVP